MSVGEKQYVVYYEWHGSGYRYRAVAVENTALAYATAFAELDHGEPIAWALVVIGEGGKSHIQVTYSRLFTYEGPLLMPNGLNANDIRSAAHTLHTEVVRDLAHAEQQSALAEQAMPY